MPGFWYSALCPGVRFAEGMTSYLYAHKVRIFSIRISRHHSAMNCGRTQNVLRWKTESKSNLSARGMCTQRIWRKLCWPSGCGTQCGWPSFPPWSPVPRTSRAKQSDGQDVFEARRWEMLALLLLAHRRRIGVNLRACAHLVALPFADLPSAKAVSRENARARTTGKCDSKN